MSSQRFNATFGLAQVAITPNDSVELSGYPFVTRQSTGAHDDLFASAVVVGSGPDRVALLSLDLIAVGREWVESVRDRVEQSTGIVGSRVMVFATHTHSGPPMPTNALIDDGLLGQVSTAYAELVADRAVQTIVEADAKRSRGSLGLNWAIVDPPVGRNRRSEDGPYDPNMPVIGFFDAEDRLSGVLVSVNCHPTVLHADNLLLTADLAWGVRHQLRSLLTDQSIVIYATGSAGDQSTRTVRREPSFSRGRSAGGNDCESCERVGLRHSPMANGESRDPAHCSASRGRVATT